MTLQLGGEKPSDREILNRLRAAVSELVWIDQESGGAIDLSTAIEHLRRAIQELEEAQRGCG